MRLEAHVQDRSEAVYLMNKILGICQLFDTVSWCLFVCTQFRGNWSRDFGFRTRKPPRKFGVKSGLSQKRLKYGKKYFIGLYVSRYSFIPINPLLAAMRFIPFFPFFFFFSFFFFLIFVRSSSKPQHIEN